MCSSHELLNILAKGTVRSAEEEGEDGRGTRTRTRAKAKESRDGTGQQERGEERLFWGAGGYCTGLTTAAQCTSGDYY